MCFYDTTECATKQAANCELGRLSRDFFISDPVFVLTVHICRCLLFGKRADHTVNILFACVMADNGIVDTVNHNHLTAGRHTVELLLFFLHGFFSFADKRLLPSYLILIPDSHPLLIILFLPFSAYCHRRAILHRLAVVEQTGQVSEQIGDAGGDGDDRVPAHILQGTIGVLIPPMRGAVQMLHRLLPIKPIRLKEIDFCKPVFRKRIAHLCRLLQQQDCLGKIPIQVLAIGVGAPKRIGGISVTVIDRPVQQIDRRFPVGLQKISREI